MPNDFYHFNPAQALNASAAVTKIVTSEPNPYGFTKEQMEALTQGSSTLSAAVIAQYNAEQAAKAATKAKKDALAALVGGLSALAKSADANPSVTDGTLLAIGFAPRPSGGSKPQALFPPTGLIVKALPSDQAKVGWSRSAATRSNTVFTVWTSADGVNYSILTAVTRTSIVVDAPAGVAAWYRVTASRGLVVSPLSAPVAIYAPGAPAQVQLRVA